MKIGLVLGGGGARCFSQVGVLKALEEHGIEPVAVSACSSAAIIGALYCAGHSADDIMKIGEETSFLNFISFTAGSGLMGHEGITAFLKQHVPDRFEDLKIPLSTVAVDIQEGELIVLRSGDLYPAVCASNAFPGVFSPIYHLGRYLVDGGILNTVPVDIIRTMTSEPVFAVDVGLSIRRRLDLLEDADMWTKFAAPFKGKALTLPIDLVNKAYTITQARLTQMLYVMYPPTLLIKPELPEDMMPQDFGRMNEAFAAGYKRAREILETYPLPHPQPKALPHEGDVIDSKVHPSA